MGYSTREEWLQAAVLLLKETLFDPRELWLPPILRVSTGFCGGKAIGICVDPDCAKDGSTSIFIDPQLGEDAVVVLATLLHEMVHASVGIECKHKGKFVEVIRDLGLDGKPTATFAAKDSELYQTLVGLFVKLGEYPHAPLVRKRKETKPHAWVSYISVSDEDFIVRANKNTVAEKGPPKDFNGEDMVPKNPEDGEHEGPDVEDGSDADGFAEGDERFGSKENQ